MSIDDFSDDLAPDLVDEGVLTAADLEEEPVGARPPRLYDPDDPFEADSEATMIAESGVDVGGVLPAEEAAMRIEAEPPGINYDESPGYLDSP